MHPGLPPPSRAARLAALVLGGITLASALLLFNAAVFNPGRPAWFTATFEAVILVAAVFAVRVGRGKHADGPALALVCTASAVAVGSLLGYKGSGGELLGTPLLPFFLFRPALAGALAANAGWIVLERNPRRSVPLLLKGVAVAACIPAFLGPAVAFRGSVESGLAQVIAVVILFVFVTAALAASVHFFIRAFETGKAPL